MKARGERTPLATFAWYSVARLGGKDVCLGVVGRELYPRISLGRSAELAGFWLHYVNSLAEYSPTPPRALKRMQFLYLPVSSVAGNFPVIAAAVQMQQLLFKGQS